MKKSVGGPSKLYLGYVQEIVTLAGSKGGALASWRPKVTHWMLV